MSKRYYTIFSVRFILMISSTASKIMDCERKVLENRLLWILGIKERFAPGLKDTIYNFLCSFYRNYFPDSFESNGEQAALIYRLLYSQVRKEYFSVVNLKVL